jgi:hypothetical protein
VGDAVELFVSPIADQCGQMNASALNLLVKSFCRPILVASDHVPAKGSRKSKGCPHFRTEAGESVCGRRLRRRLLGYPKWSVEGIKLAMMASNTTNDCTTMRHTGAAMIMRAKTNAGSNGTYRRQVALGVISGEMVQLPKLKT